MPKDPHKADAAKYNDVVGRTVLRGIRLTDTRFDVKPDISGLDPSTWTNALRGESLETFCDPESGRLYGVFLFEVVCRHKRKRVLSVTAHYLVTYQVTGIFDDEIGTLFVERVGRVAAYPYFRALVASLTSQAAMQLPPLPIISAAPRSVNSAKDLREFGPAKILDDVKD